MNRYLFQTGCLLLSLMSLASCGKEAKTKKAQDSSNSSSRSELNVSPKELLMVAFKEGRNDEFKQIASRNKSVDLNENLKLNEEVNGNPINLDTFLTLAIKYNNRELFDYLLKDREVDPDKISHHTESFALSPLSIAVIYNRPIMVELLLKHRARIDRKDESGRTALHYAIQRRRDEIAILLIKSGANINIPDQLGRNAYTLSLEVGSEDIIDYLHGITQVHLGLEPDTKIVKDLIRVGDAHMLSKIFSHHPNLINKYESINPLILAMDIEDDNIAFQTAQVLLNYGFSANGNPQASPSPLIKAVLKNNLLIAESLLLKKADINFKDTEGHSALYYAIQNNSPELVDLLASFSAEHRYKFKISRKEKFIFRACHEAYYAERRFENEEVPEEKELEKNQRIQRRLDCI